MPADTAQFYEAIKREAKFKKLKQKPNDTNPKRPILGSENLTFPESQREHKHSSSRTARLKHRLN
ncbi:MAG: hypothetical protein MHPSP_001578, partial [Paramarteilia canceri]